MRVENLLGHGKRAVQPLLDDVQALDELFVWQVDSRVEFRESNFVAHCTARMEPSLLGIDGIQSGSFRLKLREAKEESN